MKLRTQYFALISFGAFWCVPMINGMDLNDTVAQHADSISGDLENFRTLLRQQTTPVVSLTMQEKKAHSRSFNVIALSALVGAMGYFVKHNPTETISRAHSKSRSMGVVEGAAILGPLLAPLGTAITIGFLWYKFNNLLHYQCKTERERDMQRVSEIATQNKTDLQDAFEKYKKNIDQTLKSMSENTTVQIERSHQENKQQIEAYKKIMDEHLENIATSLTTVQQELVATAHTNTELKQKFEQKALPLLHKIGVEIGELKQQTIKPLSNAKVTPAKVIPKKTHNRNSSGLICFLTHHHSKELNQHKRELSWHKVDTTKKSSRPNHSDEKNDT